MGARQSAIQQAPFRALSGVGAPVDIDRRGRVAHPDPVAEACIDDRSWSWIVTAALLLAFLISGMAWARYAVIEQVTTGMGKAIASKREQLIQSLEGGILSELMVREGDSVRAGDPLLRLDPVRFQAAYGENRSRVLALKAASARLLAEAEGRSQPSFQPEVMKEKDLVMQEVATFRARVLALNDVLSALQRTRDILAREVAITEPMVTRGLAAEVELLRLRRQVAEIEGQIAERSSRFRAEASNELVRTRAELASHSETLVAKEDQMNRTVLRAPIDGTVKNIRITTLGGVVQPGQEILQIIPVNDELLVEAKVRPSDIAFITTGQLATVKFTAYDAQLYGSLRGTVQFISPDTLREENRAVEETYYKVVVRTDESTIAYQGKELPVLPGMTATVDIKTGTVTVANSLLKPVLRLQDAFRER